MITKFKIYESYLESGRQPLYHYTNSLDEIIESNTLKKHIDAEKNETIISFTRSLYYEVDGTVIHGDIFGRHLNYRLVLDADKLKTDGYKIIPYDEVANILNDKNIKSYSKVNPNLPYRKIVNNVGVEYSDDVTDWMELEYEERCYTDITNLGKYLIAIDLKYPEAYVDDEEFLAYLKEYPHIKLTKLNLNNLWDRSQTIDVKELIDKNILNYEK